MHKKHIKTLAFLLSFLLVFQQSGFTQVAAELNIAGHLAALHSNIIQDKFRPLHLRYLSYDTQANNFKLLLDKGSLKDPNNQLIEDTTKDLLKYFFIGISLPNDSFWVNLRPDSPDNIIDDYLAQTDVGKIMLEADLQLKKDTAKATSPETPEGKLYWDKLYQKAEELFGQENITIPTLTRPWIVPGEIIIRETLDSAYIYKATLKVMLEQDYLKDSAVYSFTDPRLKALNEYSSQLIREFIIPKLTKEVNTSKYYANLRQVYYSLILAYWFKARFYGKSGLYSSLINKRDLTNFVSKESWSKTTYFKEYQKSFKDGEYNIQQPIYTLYGQSIRSYFSGGMQIMPKPEELASFGEPNHDSSPMSAVPAVSSSAVETRNKGMLSMVVVGGNSFAAVDKVEISQTSSPAQKRRSTASSPASQKTLRYLTNRLGMQEKLLAENFSEEEQEALRRILDNILANAEDNINPSISKFKNFLLNENIIRQLNEGGAWYSDRTSILRILENISIHARIYIPLAIESLKLFLLNENIVHQLSEGGAWYNERKTILRILENISIHARIIYIDSAIESLKLFLLNENIVHQLSEGEAWYNERETILRILENISIHATFYVASGIYNLRDLLLDNDFMSATKNNRVLPKELQDRLVADCINSTLHQRLMSLEQLDSLDAFDKTYMRPFFLFAIAGAIFPSFFKQGIRQMLAKMNENDNRINILIHPLSVAITAVNPLQADALKPAHNLNLNWPQDIDLDSLPIVSDPGELFGFDLAKARPAGRNIQSGDGTNKVTLKLMLKNESIPYFNYEPWAYAQMVEHPDRKYPGIAPSVYASQNLPSGVYLFKIPVSLINNAVSLDPQVQPFITRDGKYYLGFAYKAEAEYYDYCQNLTPQQAVGLFRSAAILAKEFGLQHKELISLFHDTAQGRSYDLEFVPAGCIDDIDGYTNYPNFRGQDTIADFYRGHLTTNLLSGLRYEFFGLMLFASQRLHKQNNKDKEGLARVIREGLKGYAEEILGRAPSVLERINYDWYAQHILTGFNTKQNGTDLGENNGPFSIHGLVDLADYAALVIISGVGTEETRANPVNTAISVASQVNNQKSASSPAHKAGADSPVGITGNLSAVGVLVTTYHRGALTIAGTTSNHPGYTQIYAGGLTSLLSHPWAPKKPSIVERFLKKSAPEPLPQRVDTKEGESPSGSFIGNDNIGYSYQESKNTISVCSGFKNYERRYYARLDQNTLDIFGVHEVVAARTIDVPAGQVLRDVPEELRNEPLALLVYEVETNVRGAGLDSIGGLIESGDGYILILPQKHARQWLAEVKTKGTDSLLRYVNDLVPDLAKQRGHLRRSDEFPAAVLVADAIDYKQPDPKSPRVSEASIQNMWVVQYKPDHRLDGVNPKDAKAAGLSLTPLRRFKPSFNTANSYVKELGIPIIQAVSSLVLREESTAGFPISASPIDKTGGIDFRTLPIVTQAIGNLSTNINTQAINRLSAFNLNQELQNLQRMISSELTPSAERIKEYIQAFYLKEDSIQDLDKVILCISDILRQEEESLHSTDPVLKDILVLLESGISPAEIKAIFTGLKS